MAMKLRMPPVWAFLLLIGLVVFLICILLFDGEWGERILWSLGVAAPPLAAGAIWGLMAYLGQRGRGKALFTSLKRGHDAQIAAAAPGQARETLKEQQERWQKNLDRLRQACVDVYEHPFYVLIGEPGSGKTTTLRECGLPFPPDGRLKGLGGTRDCDWFFFKGATVLDTAGRWTISDSLRGESGWPEFLKQLRRARPQCPVNGIIIVVPSDRLLEDPPDRIAEKATIIRSKLSELQSELGLQVPAHLLITKADKIPGFVQFFSFLEDDERQQLVGWAPQGDPYEPFDPAAFSSIFDDFVEKLALAENRALLHHFDHEGAARTITRFPEEIRKIQRALQTYVETIFTSYDVEDGSIFRGFFFSSATQEASALEAIFGSRKAKPVAYFVRDFYQHRVFPERGLARPSTRRERHNEKMKATVLAVSSVALSVVGGLLLLFAASNLDGLRKFTSSLKPEELAGAGKQGWEKVKGTRDSWLEAKTSYETFRADLQQKKNALIRGLDLGEIGRQWDAKAREAAFHRWPQWVLDALDEDHQTAVTRLKGPATLVAADATPAQLLEAAAASIQRLAVWRVGVQRLLDLSNGSLLKRVVPDPSAPPPADAKAQQQDREQREKIAKNYWLSLQALAREDASITETERDPKAVTFAAEFAGARLTKGDSKDQAFLDQAPWRASAEKRLSDWTPAEIIDLWKGVVAVAYDKNRWTGRTWAQLAEAFHASVASLERSTMLEIDGTRAFSDVDRAKIQMECAKALRDGIRVAADEVRVRGDVKPSGGTQRKSLAADIQAVLKWAPEPDVDFVWCDLLWRDAYRNELNAEQEKSPMWVIVQGAIESLSILPIPDAAMRSPEPPFLLWAIEGLEQFLTDAKVQHWDTRRWNGELDLLNNESPKRTQPSAFKRSIERMARGVETLEALLPRLQDKDLLFNKATRLLRAYERQSGLFLHYWFLRRGETLSEGTSPRELDEFVQDAFSKKAMGGIALIAIDRRVSDHLSELDKRRPRSGDSTEQVTWDTYLTECIKNDRFPLLLLASDGWDGAWNQVLKYVDDSKANDLRDLKSNRDRIHGDVHRYVTTVLDKYRELLAKGLNFRVEEAPQWPEVKSSADAVKLLETQRSAFKARLVNLQQSIARAVDGPKATLAALSDRMRGHQWLFPPGHGFNFAQPLVDREITPEEMEKYQTQLAKAFEHALEKARTGNGGKGDFTGTWGEDLAGDIEWAKADLESLRVHCDQGIVGSDRAATKARVESSAQDLRAKIKEIIERRPVAPRAQLILTIDELVLVSERLKTLGEWAELYRQNKQVLAAVAIKNANGASKAAAEFVDEGLQAIGRMFEASGAGIKADLRQARARVFRAQMELEQVFDPEDKVKDIFDVSVGMRVRVGGVEKAFESRDASGKILWRLDVDWSVPPSGASTAGLKMEFVDLKIPGAPSSTVLWDATASDWWPLEGRLKGALKDKLGDGTEIKLDFAVKLVQDADRKAMDDLIRWLSTWSGVVLQFP
ncbi:MAG: hypothetical protein JNJ88_16230 [Planctomycetes bacterium]|nr:hypothetical protein [Planctomycetota bacterium]